MAEFKHKDIIALRDLTKEEIELLLSTAESMREINSRDIKKVPTLRGKTIINLFYEASTRTRTSFEIAGKRLSADTVNITTKGETLADTALNLLAMKPDIIVMRHAVSGSHYFLSAKMPGCSIINAGDGTHEHPSQGLLDMLTIKDRFGRLDGLKVAIVGDILHSRVARSNILAMQMMGMRVRVCGPPTLLPRYVESLGVEKFLRVEPAIADADVIMMLRIQRERMGAGLFPTLREYSKLFGLNADRLKAARPDVLIMHPGPINRGVEIAPEVADGPYSLILDQVENGLAIRMALLFLLAGGQAGSN